MNKIIEIVRIKCDCLYTHKELVSQWVIACGWHAGIY